MKKIGFIGAFDKSNLIMYVAKVLRYMEQKVLVVDSTLMQKTKYIVPSISPTKSYVTDFERIDFAIGFKNMTDIASYLGTSEEKLQYDYVLIDIDSEESIKEFEIIDSYRNYFVTAFDMYSLKKGLSILENLKEPLKLTKILYRYELQNDDEEYLDQMSMDYKVIWSDFTIYLPNYDQDTQNIEENQKVYRLRLKRMSSGFQDGIIFIVQDILDEKNAGKVRKSIKE